MSTLILGREIVAEALRSRDIRPYLDAGLTLEFMQNHLEPAYASVFSGQDIAAWCEILRYHAENGVVPDIRVFRLSFPEGSYDLPSSRITAHELVGLAKSAINQYTTEVGNTEAALLIDAGEPIRAAEIMLETARKVLSSQSKRAIRADWDDPDFEIEKRLSLVVERGPGTGIRQIDSQIVGFQKGQLITYLGRAKAGKTTFLLVSAYHAWMGLAYAKDQSDNEPVKIKPHKVMFITTEMPYEDIRDTLTAYGAGVNPAPFLASTSDFRLGDQEADKIRDFWRREIEQYEGGFLRVIQPVGTYTLEDLAEDASKFDPDIIYIDGFYFLYDPETKKFGANWEAQDRLANQLKALALKLRIPIVISHQVREKQLNSKKGTGIDDSAMMGGSALRMASDMVIGFDKDEEDLVTINNTASRRGYFKKVMGEWDWNLFRFNVREFQYEGDGSDGY